MNWSSKFGSLPASGRVIKAEGDKLWVNIGKDVVSPGDVLRVKSKGEELIDPDTGSVWAVPTRKSARFA